MRSVYIAFDAEPVLQQAKQLVRERIRHLGYLPGSASPAHLTVTSPVALRQSQIDTVCDRLASLVHGRNLQEFRAPLGNLSTFELPERGRGVIHLPVLGEEVRCVIRYLLGELGLPKEGFDGKTPHITLATIPIANLTLCFGQSEGVALPREARFQHLSVFEREGNGAACCLEQFPLAGKAA